MSLFNYSVDMSIYPIEVLKEFYHQRWSVEECYKKIKGKFNSGTFHSIQRNQLLSVLVGQQLSAIITRLFISMIRTSNKHKVNSKISSTTIINNILPILMFDKQNTSYLKNISNILERLEKIIENFNIFELLLSLKAFRSDLFRHMVDTNNDYVE